MRYCTSLSLNEAEYALFKETGKGVKEVFLIGLKETILPKDQDEIDPCTRSL